MIIERDKTNMELYIAKGEVFKRYIIAEGRSIEDAFTNYITAATAWLKREKKPMSNFDDIDRDMREQQATKRYQEWLGSEEYQNSVQLKYEALLCDGDLLNEAIGVDGILYPFSQTGLLEDVRKRELEYENDTYYPYIAAAVMHKDATALGALLLDQITNYVMGMAIEKIQEGYDGQ